MINTDCSFVSHGLMKMLEKEYGYKYIFDTCLPTTTGGWSAFAAGIFYTPENKYVAFYVDGSRQNWIQVDATEAVNGRFTGIKAKNGEIIYSRHKTHQAISQDKSVFILGGRERVISSPADLVEFEVVGDKLMIVGEDNGN